MNRDDIIRMAREAGWSQKDIDSLLYIVETVAAAEREACAKYFDGHWRETWTDEQIAEAIRARGQE